MTITFNSVFNILLLLGAANLLFVSYMVLKRVDKRQRSHALPEVICRLAGTVTYTLGVLLPILRHKTLNVEINQTLFFSGLVLIFLPDLILWWKKRSAAKA